MTAPKPDPRPRSGAHKRPTPQEHTAALALWGALASVICPGAPQRVQPSEGEALLGYRYPAIGRAVRATPETSWRLGNVVRARMEREILRRGGTIPK